MKIMNRAAYLVVRYSSLPSDSRDFCKGCEAESDITDYMYSRITHPNKVNLIEPAQYREISNIESSDQRHTSLQHRRSTNFLLLGTRELTVQGLRNNRKEEKPNLRLVLE